MLVTIMAILAGISGFFMGAAGGFISGTRSTRLNELLYQGAGAALLVFGVAAVALGLYLRHLGHGVLATQVIFGAGAVGMIVGFLGARSR